MSFKKIYWIIQQTGVFESERLDEQLESMKQNPERTCEGSLYFVRPENSIGGL